MGITTLVVLLIVWKVISSKDQTGKMIDDVKSLLDKDENELVIPERKEDVVYLNGKPLRNINGHYEEPKSKVCVFFLTIAVVLILAMIVQAQLS